MCLKMNNQHRDQVMFFSYGWIKKGGGEKMLAPVQYQYGWPHWRPQVSNKDIFIRSFSHLNAWMVGHLDHLGVTRACSVLVVMFKHKETPQPPLPPLPFLVCADSQRSETSQLWKLVSMETRGGKESDDVAGRTAVPESAMCFSVCLCGYTGDKTERWYFPCEKEKGGFCCLPSHARYLVRGWTRDLSESEKRNRQLVLISNASLHIDWRYRLWQAESATNFFWHAYSHRL